MTIEKKQSVYLYVENNVLNQEEVICFDAIFNEIVNCEEFGEMTPESLLEIVMAVFDKLVNSGIIKEKTNGVYLFNK